MISTFEIDHRDDNDNRMMDHHHPHHTNNQHQPKPQDASMNQDISFLTAHDHEHDSENDHEHHHRENDGHVNSNVNGNTNIINNQSQERQELSSSSFDCHEIISKDNNNNLDNTIEIARTEQEIDTNLHNNQNNNTSTTMGGNIRINPSSDSQEFEMGLSSLKSKGSNDGEDPKDKCQAQTEEQKGEEALEERRDQYPTDDNDLITSKEKSQESSGSGLDLGSSSSSGGETKTGLEQQQEQGQHCNKEQQEEKELPQDPTYHYNKGPASPPLMSPRRRKDLNSSMISYAESSLGALDISYEKEIQDIDNESGISIGDMDEEHNDDHMLLAETTKTEVPREISPSKEMSAQEQEADMGIDAADEATLPTGRLTRITRDSDGDRTEHFMNASLKDEFGNDINAEIGTGAYTDTGVGESHHDNDGYAPDKLMSAHQQEEHNHVNEEEEAVQNSVRERQIEGSGSDYDTGSTSIHTGMSTLTTAASFYNSNKTVRIENGMNDDESDDADDDAAKNEDKAEIEARAYDAQVKVQEEELNKMNAIHEHQHEANPIDRIDQTTNTDYKPTNDKAYVDAQVQVKGDVEERMERMKEYYENLLQNQRQEHEEQIDEIIEQLNTIEGGYGDEISMLKDKLTKKDVMTDALTSSLADLRNKNIEMKNDLQSYQVKNQEIIQTYELVVTKFDEAKSEIDEGQKRYRTLEKKSAKETIEAVQAAQHEIRTAAESQFALAQKTYMKLKQDYQTSCEERELLKNECDELNVQVQSSKRDLEGQVSRLMAELSSVKAHLASTEADALKTNRSQVEKIQLLVDSEKVLQRKVTKAESECSEARTMLNDLVKQKDLMAFENKELNAVCEELMGIVEGRGAT
mmetsp:Transcript_3187/g.4692  ORF Transcript_3187/g.4692 Transcript_3187/m.4692 type:complete len:863 (-) Transcript_3187:225-2813(-)